MRVFRQLKFAVISVPLALLTELLCLPSTNRLPASADWFRQSALYTLVENIRRLNRAPFEYLTWVFGELARNPQPENPEDLLPQAWAKAKPEGRQLRAAENESMILS